MKIQVLRIKKLTGDTKLKAFVDVCFNDVLIVNGCQVFSGPSGLFASTPSSKSKDGKYYPIVKINDDVVKNAFNEAVMKAYNIGEQPAAPASTLSQQEVPF